MWKWCSSICFFLGSDVVNVTSWDLEETKRGGPFEEISTSHDIFINCIYLMQQIPPFIDIPLLSRTDRRLNVVVDVSCDASNPYNPLPIYNGGTTFLDPSIIIINLLNIYLDFIEILIFYFLFHFI